MTDSEAVAAIKILMDKYDEYKKRWVKWYGTPNGFDHYFRAQVEKIMQEEQTWKEGRA